jgi:anthranilate phosphoribosyltransferase
MSIARFIKEIGRGSAGARSLSHAQAHELMASVLDGGASDLQIGAFVLAMRMKGESLAELTGFLEAVQARCLPLAIDDPVLVIPSYNGSRRLPNLTPLLAMWLAQGGARVLVHGPAHDQAREKTRVTSAEIFQDLGLPAVHTEEEIRGRWSRREPAFVATATLCPALQRLLDVRWSVGVRNSGHTVAKMLNPLRGARALRLVSFTHPEFGALMADWMAQQGIDAMLLRGTEGEAVADPRRRPRLDTWIAGTPSVEWSAPAQDGVVGELPLLPPSNDAASTALYIQAVLSGEKPAPAPLAQQAQLLRGALAAIATLRPLPGMAA